MKKLQLVFLFVFVPIALHGEITFPDSVYVMDEETGFKIMLGLPPRYVELEYGTPKEKKLVFRYPSGIERWMVDYDDFEIEYETPSRMITFIKTSNSRFSTPRVKIGDPLSNIIRIYGNPHSPTRTINNGEQTYSYRKVLSEINDHETEITTIQFGVLHDRVVTIYLYIAFGV